MIDYRNSHERTSSIYIIRYFHVLDKIFGHVNQYSHNTLYAFILNRHKWTTPYSPGTRGPTVSKTPKDTEVAHTRTVYHWFCNTLRKLGIYRSRYRFNHYVAFHIRHIQGDTHDDV